jgi:hypothetical protein
MGARFRGVRIACLRAAPNAARAAYRRIDARAGAGQGVGREGDQRPTGMSDPLGAPTGAGSARMPLVALYARAVALLLLLAGLARACQILGITPDGRDFADLTPAWRAGATALLLVDLFAAVGLWVGAAWGPVMWAVALAVEMSMYTLFSDLFGNYPLRVVVHGVLFAVFLVLALLEWRRTVEL